MMTYDAIGAGYNATRRADPYLTDRLYRLLGPDDAGLFLDIGCGTGNYLAALAVKGLRFYGVDPSGTMLDIARATNPFAHFIQATAENMPLPDAFFDGAIAVLTLHHWNDLAAGLAGVARVLKPGAPLVLFSFLPEQLLGYWLRHYFPEMIDRCIVGIPALNELEAMLQDAGFGAVQTEKYFIRQDLSDHFLYSHKSRPAEYLKAGVRDNTSAFRLHCPPGELEAGLRQLEADILSGAITEVIRSYEHDLGDYIFIRGQRG